MHIDELARAEAYRPAALSGTSYRRQLIGSGQDADLHGLRNERDGESQREFQKTVRNLALTGIERAGIYTPDGDVVGGVATARNGGVLEARLLRVVNTAVADTLARHLLFQLRQHARREGATIIQVSDPYLSQQVKAAVLDDGFHRGDAGYFGYVIDGCGSAEEV